MYHNIYDKHYRILNPILYLFYIILKPFLRTIILNVYCIHINNSKTTRLN